MTIAALSTAGFSQYIAASSSVSASQQAFQSLQQSLASGNLGQAQAAFNTYQQLNQAGAAASSSTGSSSSATATPSQFSTDLTALGTAIGSGNLATAQSAFTTLQGELKSAPPQAVTNAESAVAQTVSWVDDLLNLSSNNIAEMTPVDPTTSMLDSAYGLTPSNASTTNPTTSILENAYGASGSGTSSSSTAAPASASSGNLGSGSSVNAYA